ncbi:MAG: hypothetical protein QGE94_07050 [Desulfobacterales bacterium]|nr:hypothetical protein [Desulfobacterales bacterium]
MEACADEFAECLFIFFDFVYGYIHDDTIIIKTVPDQYWMEFFEDFLLRNRQMPDFGEYHLIGVEFFHYAPFDV